MADTPQRPGRQEQDAPVAPSSAEARTGLVIQFVRELATAKRLPA